MSSHLIHTQVIEASFKNKTAAIEGQKILQQRFYEAMLPIMDQVMHEYKNVKQPIRIDKLELDIGKLPADIPEDLLKQRLQEAFESELKKAFLEQVLIPNPSLQRTSKTSASGEQIQLKSDAEILFIYLESGRLPWWVSQERKKEFDTILEKVINEQPELLTTWLKNLPISLTISKRLVHIIREKQLEVLISKGSNWTSNLSFLGPLGTLVKALIHKSDLRLPEIHFYLKSLFLFSQLNHQNKLSTFLNKAFSNLAKTDEKNINSDLEFIRAITSILLHFNDLKVEFPDVDKYLFHPKLSRQISLKKISGNSYWRKIIENISIHPKSKKNLSTWQKEVVLLKSEEKRRWNKTSPESDESMVIHNAGLVLTAAFLPSFFSTIGLAEAKKFVSKTDQSRAVFTLQHMVSNSQIEDESELLLNKLLCGVHPSDSLEFVLPLEQKIIDEIPLLLESMASQWTALKSSSGKMISEGFLKREGLLRKVQRGYQLQIQRQAFDILLDRLPWSIGLIKLPWMEELISVEW